MDTWTLPEAYKGNYRLKFTDPSFDGLVVVMRKHTLGALRAASKTIDINLDDARSGKLNKKDWKNLVGSLDQFAKHLVEWNLKDDEGFLVPSTRAGVDTVDVGFLFQIYMVWLRLIIDQSIIEGVEPDDIPMGEIEDESNGE